MDAQLTMQEFIAQQAWVTGLTGLVLLFGLIIMLGFNRWITRNWPIVQAINENPFHAALYHSITNAGLSIGYGLIMMAVMG